MPALRQLALGGGDLFCLECHPKTIRPTPAAGGTNFQKAIQRIDYFPANSCREKDKL